MILLKRYFFNGLLVTVPVALSIYVLARVFFAIESLSPFPYPGLGVLVLLASVLVIGWLSSLFFTGWIFRMVDYVFEKLPLIQLLYLAIKDLLEAFVGEKTGFSRPVYVELGDGVGALGFLTNEDLSELEMPDNAAVYLPQSYNFAGNLIVVPKDRITDVRVKGEDLMRLVLSGGTGEIGN